MCPNRIIEELLLVYFSRILCKTHTNSARSNGRDASAASLDISKELVLMTFTRRWYACLLTFLAEPLSKLFANSLRTAVVPTDWRLVIICPVHKKGDAEDVSNYRPVSLTSMICKIFEGS